MASPWIIHGCPWTIHGYQGILFVTKWHTIQVEIISTRPISTIFRRASVRFSGFPGFHLFWFYIFLIYIVSGGAVDHWGQQGPPRIILEVFCLSVTFSEIPKSRNIDFLVFPVTVFEEIHGHRCGIEVQPFSNPWFIQQRCFVIDLFMVGVSLASRWSNLLITQ